MLFLLDSIQEVVLAQMHQTGQWDYRYFLWIGSMLLVLAILFMAAVAVFVGRERSER